MRFDLEFRSPVVDGAVGVSAVETPVVVDELQNVSDLFLPLKQFHGRVQKPESLSSDNENSKM